jgi:hypothetical protein
MRVLLFFCKQGRGGNVQAGASMNLFSVNQAAVAAQAWACAFCIDTDYKGLPSCRNWLVARTVRMGFHEAESCAGLSNGFASIAS